MPPNIVFLSFLSLLSKLARRHFCALICLHKQPSTQQTSSFKNNSDLNAKTRAQESNYLQSKNRNLKPFQMSDESRDNARQPMAMGWTKYPKETSGTDRPDDAQTILTNSQHLFDAGLGTTQQNQSVQHLSLLRRLPSAGQHSLDNTASNRNFQQQAPSASSVTASTNNIFQQQYPRQFRPQQRLPRHDLSMAMMGQQPSAGMGSFFVPHVMGGGLQLPTFGNPIPFQLGNVPTTVPTTALGFSIFPCKSRGMPKDHNPQVSFKISSLNIISIGRLGYTFLLKIFFLGHSLSLKNDEFIIFIIRRNLLRYCTKTAYFVLPTNARHGHELKCTHPACQRKGIRFVYCKVCNVPVAKINFTTRHKHGFPKKSPNVSVSDDTCGDTGSTTGYRPDPAARPRR